MIYVVDSVRHWVTLILHNWLRFGLISPKMNSAEIVLVVLP
jgi:hypothetical protein